MWQLLVVFDLARLLARAGFAVFPCHPVQKFADFCKLLGGEDILNDQQHGAQRN